MLPTEPEEHRNRVAIPLNGRNESRDTTPLPIYEMAAIIEGIILFNRLSK
jgi:hypothetical protein